MNGEQTRSTADDHALKSLALAAVGLVLGIFAFRLQLRGGDNKFFTYSLGLVCSGFYVSSFTQLVKALRVKSAPQAGAPTVSRVLVTALAMTLVGVAVFTLSSVLTNYMVTLDNLSGIEILVGLIASIVPFAGPIILGAAYFYWMQWALCESGWNIGAALIAAIVSAGGSIYAWYALNIQFGPQIYELVVA
jgi:hypothetical protein